MCLSTDIGIPNPGFDYNEPPFVIPAKSEKCLQRRFMSRFSDNNNTSVLLPNWWAKKVEFRQYFILLWNSLMFSKQNNQLIEQLIFYQHLDKFQQKQAKPMGWKAVIT